MSFPNSSGLSFFDGGNFPVHLLGTLGNFVIDRFDFQSKVNIMRMLSVFLEQ